MKSKFSTYSPGSMAALVICVIAVAITAFLLINRRSVIDHIAVWQFTPTSEVKKLAQQSGMSNHGEFLYMASQPQIDNRDAFNEECQNKDSTTAVLGCYTADRIYIFNVTDSRLDGIKTVTAAHEMLHAAYARLSSSERAHVDTMLEAAYKKLLSDDDLKNRMEAYGKTEPGQRNNELHSVLGTEFSNLPNDLESYYHQYFSDRSKVVAAHDKYRAVFTKLQDQAKTIQAKMKKLENTIESSTTRYTNDVKQLNEDISSFNSRASRGDFSSQSQFERERAALEARANKLEKDRTTINGYIKQYNQLNAKLTEIAAQDASLNQSINSTLPPAPTVQ